MKTFLTNLLKTFHDLLTSKKVLTAVGTVLTSYLTHDPDIKKTVLMTGVALLLGQGAADFGKAAKPPTP
jgi:hypothetical protein